MEKEIQNSKQLWSEPQITEIEVKMTAEGYWTKSGLNSDGATYQGIPIVGEPTYHS